tara:strand:- start:1887 stop:2267 length:381 start_codon:yes stop_codon:yes gene_type:complete
VPIELHYLFETAQGATCYGCYFYPLYALGCEQLFRVLEASLRYRCAALDASTKRMPTFNDMLTWLHENGHLDDGQIERWHMGRKLRNEYSHLDKQGLSTPTETVTLLCVTAELINGLFSGSDAEKR